MSALNNQPLPKPLRTQLENTVKAARDVAEVAANAALVQLAVGEGKAPDYLTDEQKGLRRRLRAHGRALGDAKAADDSQSIRHLVWETAYEHWHRMLFARFLAENGLLLWEPGAPVTLAECDEMAQDPATSLGAKSGWDLAGKLAARMLPQVFKPQHPVFDLAFAIEHQRKLESMLAALPEEVFKASDSLGWVYQFWQAKRKQEVNESEVKIGADEVSVVTQLFTEPYMVDFLLHNSLGAWWATRHPSQTCPVPLTYLRTLEDGTPAAGKFEGWPDSLAEFKLLDPCCGSGHFLVAAFLLLVPMRMASEGLTAMDAVDFVLQDNLHGLELDARCVEIAVFALALAAWRFLDENGEQLGVRAEMPSPRVACCGLKVAAKPEDWMALVPDDAPNSAYLRQEMRLLHVSFAQAPLLGSLLDPARSLQSDLVTSNFETLRNLLERALATEGPVTLWGQSSELNDDNWDLAFTARGLLDAAQILDKRYHLVVTNVPYLGRRDQCDDLKRFSEYYFPSAKSDLANVFLERCLELCKGESAGVVQIVMPQNWLFLGSYSEMRELLLKTHSWLLLAVLGDKAFETPLGVSPILLSIANGGVNAQVFSALSTELDQGPAEKSFSLLQTKIIRLLTKQQLENPDSRISLQKIASGRPLSDLADSYQGVITGDKDRFVRGFWEVDLSGSAWEYMSATNTSEEQFGGMETVLFWEKGAGTLHEYAAKNRHKLHDMHESGNKAWSRRGVRINPQGDLRASPYMGEIFDGSASVIVPRNEENLLAILAYCSSTEFSDQVRKLDKKRNVTNGTFVKVPFDISHWSQIANVTYSDGFPKPFSNTPEHWIFHGYPQSATDPLQVAVARLCGYRWPAETDTDMELSAEARTWISYCDKLVEHADDDGIVCLPSVRGESAAHDRLLKILIATWETVQPDSWKPAVLDKLLADADWAGKSLDTWLREKFFEQHAKRFHHRPFIWHVWDGLKDGFAALVNYHRLDAKNLERLIHTYLGDWIRQQEGGVRDGVDGAPTRLAAAQDLKRRLELILEGEKPYDIFVRWKPLAEQAIGWNPDLNDGVRMNIRPFMTAEVLRHNKKPKLNITWDKDRGKDSESAPWFKVHKGDRVNDHHLALAEKTGKK